MNRLMKMAVIVAGVGAMLGFAGCGGDSPDKVALDFMQTFYSGKASPDYLAKHCTKDTATVCTLWGEDIRKKTQGVDFTFTVTDTKLDGDSATVTFNVKHAGGSGSGKVNLVKTDGRWLVNMSQKELLGR